MSGRQFSKDSRAEARDREELASETSSVWKRHSPVIPVAIVVLTLALVAHDWAPSAGHQLKSRQQT